MDNEILLKKQLLKLETDLLDPEIRINHQQLKRLLADDFFEFGSSGNIFYKEDCIGPGGVGVRRLSLDNFEIHPLALDVVLTTYRINDETRNINTLRSSIWKFIDGRWQMFFHQGTPTKK